MTSVLIREKQRRFKTSPEKPGEDRVETWPQAKDTWGPRQLEEPGRSLRRSLLREHGPARAFSPDFWAPEPGEPVPVVFCHLVCDSCYSGSRTLIHGPRCGDPGCVCAPLTPPLLTPVDPGIKGGTSFLLVLGPLAGSEK